MLDVQERVETKTPPAGRWYFWLKADAGLQIGIGHFGVFPTKEIADEKAADMIQLNPTVKLEFLGSYAEGDGPPEAVDGD